MTRDEIVSLVLVRAGQRQNDTTLRDQLRTELSFIQSKLETGVRVGVNDAATFLPWFLVKESALLTQAIGVSTVTLPTDFLREYDQDEAPTLWYYSEDNDEDPWIGLVKGDLSALRRDFPGTAEAPGGYAMLGSMLFVLPIPTEARLIRLQYYGSEAALSDSVAENAWTTYASDILVGELSLAGARITREANWQMDALSESKVARERLYNYHTAQLESGRDRTMGEAP